MGHASNIRLPAVAGAFYPAGAEALGAAVEELLAEGRLRVSSRAHGGRSRAIHADQAPLPKALIVPHAGYVYSGPIAASAYALIEPFAAQIRRVVLLGPAHRVFLKGLAAPEASLLRTPLGDVPVDTAALHLLAHSRPGSVGTSAEAHAREHSLEVELPFLQRVTPDAKIVPIVVGRAPATEVARVLDALWGGRETVIVVSSDLSHHQPYEAARDADRRTASRILALDTAPLDGEDACGAASISGLLAVARARGLTAELVDLRSSGDTRGPRTEVVGYGAFAFYERAADAPVRANGEGRSSTTSAATTTTTTATTSPRGGPR